MKRTSERAQNTPSVNKPRSPTRTQLPQCLYRRTQSLARPSPISLENGKQCCSVRTNKRARSPRPRPRLWREKWRRPKQIEMRDEANAGQRTPFSLPAEEKIDCTFVIVSAPLALCNFISLPSIDCSPFARCEAPSQRTRSFKLNARARRRRPRPEAPNGRP